ncbi:MAG: M24 family metallopeptidase [Anaerolineae bacterium]|jgi:Xaa-Pro aminopeptidase
MKRDLDRLMEKRDLDAFVVTGSGRDDPALTYMTNGARLTHGYVIQKRGQAPVLLCSPMERDEAAASGLTTVTLNKYDFIGILHEQGDRLAATVELYRRIFADMSVTGRVGFYGQADQGRTWVLFNSLNANLNDVTVYGDFDTPLIDEARATKDDREARRVKEVGRRTCAIVKRTIDFLRSHTVSNDVLLQADGNPLTVGRVHDQISRFIAEERLVDPEGFIFSIGRDAGIPHSKGQPEDVMALGKTIVFDIFPREAGGGYFFDMTRTFCLGYAPPEVADAYRDVKECVGLLIEAYTEGVEARHYQQMTCDFFEDRGHPTIASDSKTETGYVHSVGHGLGLAVHEEPRFSDDPTNRDVLRSGHIFTCEPGLYYPDQGFGVRLEDVIWIDNEGTPVNLTDYPKDLVIDL